MERIEVLVAKREGVELPTYATDASSGVDLCAFIDEPVVLNHMERSLIPTGLSISIPEGYEAEIRPRSGLAIKYGVTVLNTPGTIDADYRGEVKIILVNLGNEAFVIKGGDRIAQMVFNKVARVEWKIVDRLEETERGQGGFGSTGHR
ncbi:MAG TPA: dUTP diphosphatase [Syntrophorhabdaceae bacterium]|nr:dUTP diphosphatase [Syntrophorhabdaceae bacterium]